MHVTSFLLNKASLYMYGNIEVLVICKPIFFYPQMFMTQTGFFSLHDMIGNQRSKNQRLSFATIITYNLFTVFRSVSDRIIFGLVSVQLIIIRFKSWPCKKNIRDGRWTKILSNLQKWTLSQFWLWFFVHYWSIFLLLSTGCVQITSALIGLARDNKFCIWSVLILSACVLLI